MTEIVIILTYCTVCYKNVIEMKGLFILYLKANLTYSYHHMKPCFFYKIFSPISHLNSSVLIQNCTWENSNFLMWDCPFKCTVYIFPLLSLGGRLLKCMLLYSQFWWKSFKLQFNLTSQFLFLYISPPPPIKYIKHYIFLHVWPEYIILHFWRSFDGKKYHT